LDADFTYIWTAEGWLYVAAVTDLFSRRVVGWSMSATMTAELVTDALVMAIWRRGKPDALIHHSDRGSQYTSDQFQRLMADHGKRCGEALVDGLRIIGWDVLRNVLKDVRSWQARFSPVRNGDGVLECGHGADTDCYGTPVLPLEKLASRGDSNTRPTV
jgi:hypothetical protein